MREEFVDPHKRSQDESDDGEMLDEVGLRPRSLSDFVGQRELKEHLSIVLEAARRRGQAADHLLFAGPPGLGKTTLAGIVATEMSAHLHVTSGPALERAGDLAAILTKLEDNDVLFIDEIHRLIEHRDHAGSESDPAFARGLEGKRQIQLIRPDETAGRAARHLSGECVLFCDKVTDSIQALLDTTAYRRSRQLASALAQAGIGKNDTVAVMLPNTPPMVEAHFGIPMAGAVLNALNTRLDPETVAFMLDHGEAKVLIVDAEFAGVVKRALALRQSGARSCLCQMLSQKFLL